MPEKSPLNLMVDAWTTRMQYERARQREELVRNAIAQGYTVRTLVTRETLQGQLMDYIIVDEASQWDERTVSHE